MFHVELRSRPSMPKPLDSVQAELDALASEGLRRTLREVQSDQSAELIINGRRVINFSSNNYLGLANHPLLREAATRAMAEHGFGAGASRLIAGNLTPHRALERRIATWKRTEGALLFNSGYHANVGILSALAGPEDVIFSDELNHASIIDGCRLSRARTIVYPHRDVESLERSLRAHSGRRRIIVSDSVFSMDGDRAPTAELARVARDHEALLVLDEAHAAGVVDDDVEVDLRMGTLGKALGGFGAYVAGAQPLLELLLNRARSFVFTTALPVPVVAAAHAAIDWLTTDEGRARISQLIDNYNYFCSRSICDHSHIVPIRVRGGDPRQAMEACEALLARGIFAQGIRPPTVPPGTARLRFALMATHTRAQLDAALEALADLRDYFEEP
jgi:8-amino-7-oxononanoate synthase